MNKPQWYIEDRLGSLVRCRDRQEAEEIVALNMARYPSTGPWRAVQMIEIDPGAPVPDHPEHDLDMVVCTDVDAATRDQLFQAFRQARLQGQLEQAMTSPSIATCLHNIVHANQANPYRSYDLSTDGQTVYIHPQAPLDSISVDSAGMPCPADPAPKTHSPVDLKRLASGDDC